jgi:hypothetical protein
LLCQGRLASHNSLLCIVMFPTLMLEVKLVESGVDLSQLGTPPSRIDVAPLLVLSSVPLGRKRVIAAQSLRLKSLRELF